MSEPTKEIEDVLTKQDNELSTMKANFLKEIEFHHKHCGDLSSCGVQTWLLFELAKRAGIRFTKEESE